MVQVIESNFVVCSIRNRKSSESTTERVIKLIEHGKRRIFNLQCTETNGVIVRIMRNKFPTMIRRRVHRTIFFALLGSFTYVGSYISMNNASQFNVVTFTGMYPTPFNCYFRRCCIGNRKNKMWKKYRKYATEKK